MYPIEKYKFYVANKVDGSPYKVIAVSTYAGRTVRGVARCSSEDTFSLEKGKELAAARCELKVAEKRHARAQRKLIEAIREEKKAYAHSKAMEKYHEDTLNQMHQVEEHIESLMKTL